MKNKRAEVAKNLDFNKAIALLEQECQTFGTESDEFIAEEGFKNLHDNLKVLSWEKRNTKWNISFSVNQTKGFVLVYDTLKEKKDVYWTHPNGVINLAPIITK